ncbi:FAM72 protein-domain-containing protein [Auriculariales sp. MPI-PUGE-AT-0066]|nr:FAM72 protein-domain-containing protein [Auriculariales sp. MPI-PUGE-AT-0066]
MPRDLLTQRSSSPLPALEPFDVVEEEEWQIDSGLLDERLRTAAHAIPPFSLHSRERAHLVDSILRHRPPSPPSSFGTQSDPESLSSNSLATLSTGSSPPAHAVWVVKCTQCNMLFSNRGMKAVLLLYPGLALYSTDALPRNCSPLGSCAPDPPPAQARTCACLTQTLYCHGCGNSIGYFIVAPCAACTIATRANEGTQAHNHNGHRFVFHSAGVTAVPRQFSARHHPQPAQSVKTPNIVNLKKQQRYSLQIDPDANATVFWHQLTQAGELSPVLDNGSQWR